MSQGLGTIMIVDDEDIDQRQYRRILERSGLADDIYQFHYADEALDWLLANPDHNISLIFLDVNIPRMDGFEFLEALETAVPDLQTTVIIMLTTSLNPDDKERALQHARVRGFFNKPLKADHLMDAVQILHAS